MPSLLFSIYVFITSTLGLSTSITHNFYSAELREILQPTVACTDLTAPTQNKPRTELLRISFILPPLSFLLSNLSILHCPLSFLLSSPLPSYLLSSLTAVTGTISGQSPYRTGCLAPSRAVRAALLGFDPCPCAIIHPIKEWGRGGEGKKKGGEIEGQAKRMGREREGKRSEENGQRKRKGGI